MGFESQSLAQLAVRAEVADQLAHDMGNLLFSLRTRFELAKASGQELPSWDCLKKECQELTARLKEWRSLYRVQDSPPAMTEVNGVLRQVIDALPGEIKARITLTSPTDVLSIVTRAETLSCLCHLLLERIVATSDSAARVILYAQHAGDGVVLRVSVLTADQRALDPFLAGFDEHGPEKESSLARSTCRSLLSQLEASALLTSEPEVTLAITLPSLPLN